MANPGLALPANSQPNGSSAISSPQGVSGRARDSVGRREARGPALLGTLLLLGTGFADGIAFGLAERFAAPSPWLFILPLIGGVLSVCWLQGARPGTGHLMEAYLLIVFMAALTTLQALSFAEFNLFGMLQLIAFVALLIVMQGVFANAPAAVATILSSGLRNAHYLLCGYVAVAFAVWHVTGLDISLIRLISPAESGDVAFYSFRPAGFGKEPQWTAFALAASYIGVFTLLPRERLRALLALAAAAALLQSGTLLLFAALFTAAFLRQSGWSLRQPGTIVLLALALSALTALFWERTNDVVGAADASLLQRAESIDVAWGVVDASFPLGAGYGNFRQVADYDSPRWTSFLDLSKTDFYKSDFVALNFMAELGVFGIVILVWVFLLLARGGGGLPLAYFGLLVVLSGTLLLPPLLIVAAASGRQIQQRAPDRRRPQNGASARLVPDIRQERSY